ncbi:MAG: hypothetical protein ACK40U_07755 [Fervidobacterium pennivorans]
MSIKPLISLFTWALVLEMLTFFYYLPSSNKPFEFYLSLFLIFFTTVFLVIFIVKEKREYTKDNEKHEEGKKEKM